MNIKVLTLLTLIYLVPACGQALEREPYGFTLRDIEPALEEELAERGAGDNIRLSNMLLVTPDSRGFSPDELDAFRQHTGFSEADGHSLAITYMDFDKASRIFSAVMKISGSLKKPAGKEGTIEIKGRYNNVIEIPTLSRRMLRGDMIQPDDIEWMEIPENKLRDGTVRDKSKLIGRILKRRLSVGRPIRHKDVEMPQIISRNNLVQMVYRKGNIELITDGRALDDGSIGEVIRLRNEKSGKIIRGEVQPSGEVVVNYGNTPDWDKVLQSRAERLLNGKEG